MDQFGEGKTTQHLSMIHGSDKTLAAYHQTPYSYQIMPNPTKAQLQEKLKTLREENKKLKEENERLKLIEKSSNDTTVQHFATQSIEPPRLNKVKELMEDLHTPTGNE